MTETGKEYGTALFMLACEEQQQKTYAEALQTVKAVFLVNPLYLDLLASPHIPLQDRLDRIGMAFAEAVPTHVLSYLKLLCEKGRISFLMESIEAYQALLDASEHISQVKVTSAVALTEAERQKLAKSLLHLFRLKLMKSGYTPWKEEDRTVWKKRIGYLAYQAAALPFSHEALIKKYEALVMAVPESDTIYEQSALPIAYYFDRDWCENLAQYPYGDTTFAGPENYDAFLSSLYGNYMELPPEDKRENRHQIQELDLGE